MTHSYEKLITINTILIVAKLLIKSEKLHKKSFFLCKNVEYYSSLSTLMVRVSLSNLIPLRSRNAPSCPS